MDPAVTLAPQTPETVSPGAKEVSAERPSRPGVPGGPAGPASPWMAKCNGSSLPLQMIEASAPTKRTLPFFLCTQAWTLPVSPSPACARALVALPPTATRTPAAMLELAETTSDEALRLAAHNTAGMVAFYRGDFAAARAHLETAVAIYDPDRHSPARLAALALDHDCGVSATAHLACTLSVQGHGERAHAAMRQALALAETIAHPPSQALAWNFATIFYGDRRDAETVRAVNEARRRHAAEHGFEVFLWLAEVYGGWLDAEDGRPDDGLARMRAGLHAYRAAGTVMGTATFLGLLAETCARAGRTEEALAVVADALAMSARTGMRYWDAELRRIEGTLRLADDPAAADACFVDAMAIARLQRADAMVLRAATELARCRRRDDPSGARALLAEVVAATAKAADDPWVRAARALLADIGSTATPRRRR